MLDTITGHRNKLRSHFRAQDMVNSRLQCDILAIYAL